MIPIFTNFIEAVTSRIPVIPLLIGFHCSKSVSLSQTWHGNGDSVCYHLIVDIC